MIRIHRNFSWPGAHPLRVPCEKGGIPKPCPARPSPPRKSEPISPGASNLHQSSLQIITIRQRTMIVCATSAKSISATLVQVPNPRDVPGPHRTPPHPPPPENSGFRGEAFTSTKTESAPWTRTPRYHSANGTPRKSRFSVSKPALSARSNPKTIGKQRKISRSSSQSHLQRRLHRRPPAAAPQMP